MNTSKLVRFSAASALLLASYGCHRPTPEEIAAQTAETTAALITEAGETAQTVNSISALDTASAGVRTAAGSSPCPATEPACAAPDAPSQDQFDAQVAQIRRFLRERIFIEENLESSDSFSATFRVPGTAVCSDGTTTPDPTCVSQVDAAELRVKAWPQLGGGVNLQLLVSPDRFELVAFELRQKTLAAITDLPQSKKALDFIATTSGSTTTPTPRVLEGKLEARLTKNDDKDFTISYAVLGGVKVVWANAQGQESSFTTASTNPLSSLRVEGPQKRVTLEINVGETKYTSPYLDVSNASNPHNGKPLTYFLSGFSGKMVAQDGRDEVQFTNLGLGGGQSYYQVGDLRLATIDVNKDSWRHLDLKLQRDATGNVVAVVSPELDVLLGTFYSALRQLGGSSYPEALQDESLRWRLNGSSAPSVTRVAPNVETGFPGGVKVLSGMLTVSTSRSGFTPLVVNQGQCLVTRQSAPSADAHPVYGTYEAMACP